MESEIIKLALNQGLWAVLFVVLLFYVLKIQEKRDRKSEEREEKSEEREGKLMNALDFAQKNNQQFAIAIQRLSDDVVEIKETLKVR